jgi:hypothetical protein
MLALVVGGCATRSYREDGTPPVASPRTVYQTQVAMGECVFKPQPEAALLGAIAAALLSSAVSQGVNYVGKAIEESAKEVNDRASATRNVEVTYKTFGPCIEVIRGWFYEGFVDAAASRQAFQTAAAGWAAPGQGKAIDANHLTLLWQRRMWPAAQPDFVFEAEVVPLSAENAEESVLALAPVYARLDAPISSAWLRPSRSREVAVFFAFAGAGGDTSFPDTPGGGIAVGRMEPGEDRPFPPPAVDTTNTPNRQANESKWFKLAVGETKKPMTLAALVTEHQDAEPFLQFIADVFNGAKPEITTALQAALPALSPEAQETEQAQKETAATTYESALANALGASETCAAGVTSPVTSASEVRGLVRTLNKAARAAGEEEFDESLVPLSTNAAAVQSGCRALGAELRAAVG